MEVRSIAALGMALAAWASVPAMAIAQEAASQTSPAHRGAIHHRFHDIARHPVHRFEAQAARRRAAPALAAPEAAPFGLSWPHIAPYPDNKGDQDGLSEDPNDCNKGCVGGASD